MDEPSPLDDLPETPWVSGAAFLVDAAGQWLADEEWADADPEPPDQEELRREAGWGVAELGGHVAGFARAMPGRGEPTSRRRVEEAGERLEQHAFRLIVTALRAVAAAEGRARMPEEGLALAGELAERLAGQLGQDGEPPPASDVDRYFGAVEAARRLWYGVGDLRPEEADAAWRLAVDTALIAAAPVGLLMAD